MERQSRTEDHPEVSERDYQSWVAAAETRQLI